MGGVAHNILYVPSRGAMGRVLEENFQVCLLKSFMIQLFQRNSILAYRLFVRVTTISGSS